MDTQVPGYAVRSWTPTELDEIAQRFLELHVPDGGLGPSSCAMCETLEACDQRRWARRWLRNRMIGHAKSRHLLRLRRLLFWGSSR
jgi:hypothetical protein